MKKKGSMDTVGRRKRKRSSALGAHKKSVMVICVILCLLTGTLSVNAVGLYNKNKIYRQQEAELKAQIKEEEERSKEVEEFEAYVKTDEYIKDVAEEKLGLVDPGEIIFKAGN
ncbi:septum formation initiator family protein [Mediterraneibacter agrestimuris]|uniref:septum formation initiator family protein n=1 Tax=Mediterraneibacter agrestimuris TaxID=2941333 RepID=UPI00203EA0B0|nr:septum formation initiator family protein [Mediterraneibacter agrestimuris]